MDCNKLCSVVQDDSQPVRCASCVHVTLEFVTNNNFLIKFEAVGGLVKIEGGYEMGLVCEETRVFVF